MPSHRLNGNRLRKDSQWSCLKRIKRLEKGRQQSETTSIETEAALIDAVVTLFDPSLRGKDFAKDLLGKSLQERVQQAMPPLGDKEKPFSLRLVFWIIYFIRHHEWLCPQLVAAHSAEEALWQWVESVAHFYSRILIDTARVYPGLFDRLPADVSWNLPIKQSDGYIKWPMRMAMEWLESLVEPDGGKTFRDMIFPQKDKNYQNKCWRRLVDGKHLPHLGRIQKWANIPWRFKSGKKRLKAQTLQAVLLWCRILQAALILLC